MTSRLSKVCALALVSVPVLVLEKALAPVAAIPVIVLVCACFRDTSELKETGRFWRKAYICFPRTLMDCSNDRWCIKRSPSWLWERIVFLSIFTE
jgi:hypothetical protein